jgi:hypothetical protein
MSNAPVQSFSAESLLWHGTASPGLIGPTSGESSPPLAKVLKQAGALDLEHPLVITIEPDGDAYIARSSFLPQLFGLGDSVDLAGTALGREIESLWKDLNEDDNFTDDWLEVRARLKTIIVGDAK